MINVNLYQSVFQAYTHPDLMRELSFDEFVKQMIECQAPQKCKEDGMLFNCCSWKADPQCPPSDKFNPNLTKYKRENLIRRCKENVDYIFCLLLDVDGTMTLDQTIQVWQDYEFFIYSTFSNSERKEKYRLVVPLQTPMSNLEFDSRHEIMCQTFNVDGASFTISQAFYFPTYHSENKHLAFAYHNKTDKRYDALQLQSQPINIARPEYQPTFTDDNPCQMAIPVLKTLLSGGNLRYADAMPLAILCKSKGINYTQYEYIVHSIAGADSSLRDSKQVNLQHLWNTSYNSFMTDRRAGELMRRLNCDTWRFERKPKRVT